jgi:hypothetical protein
LQVVPPTAELQAGGSAITKTSESIAMILYQNLIVF